MTDETKAILIKKCGNPIFLNGGLFSLHRDGFDTKNSVHIPNESFEAILALFERYNFTITESTPLDIEVAVDPEMLGKVFEKLVTLRHDTGSYYTPKVIVSFMCREAIKGYLGDYEQLVDEHDPNGISVKEARDLLRKLGEITVCDPACGSGAYLVGMLHELFQLTKILDTRADQATARDDYERKLNIIQNNLYGVDIDEFATNIAMLRLWLSLVIEFEGDDPPPLPNLDFKIAVGDSLIAPDPQDVNLGVQHELVQQYQAKKAEHMKAYRFADKQVLEKEIKELRESIRGWARGTQAIPGFDWVVEFAEVFNGGGFDVVIANPPYGLTCTTTLRNQYFPQEAQSKDSYGIFMARAIQLMKVDACFSFIVSDTWRTIRSHRPLRKHLHENTTVLHLIDLPTWVFDATVYTCILTLHKTSPTADDVISAGDLRNLPRDDWNTLEAYFTSISANGPAIQTESFALYKFPQSLISTYTNFSFFIGSPEMYLLMSDVNLSKLHDLGAAVHGISTGNNKKYIRAEKDAGGNYPEIEDWMKMPEDEIKELTDCEKTEGVDKDWEALRGCFVPLKRGERVMLQAGGFQIIMCQLSIILTGLKVLLLT
ncbi:hypothetical protein CEE37_05785 [candidate division LCP-89 bacterium B3_LCP]|uniref:site-specific DNA-methyltransferase (adenine-specific) n=1 Tax=candidate division LCP-89 bacterium B3_LCP TaxID=2012998 RepID=A0A532V1S4_UNCL8|nr:MAG: hypothetical protein CEE37_05785 [candidate division LCP-89 bacterium B3_LCP]